jgi:hypothetical protein
MKMDKESLHSLLRQAIGDIEKKRESGEEHLDEHLEECPTEDVFSYYLGLSLSATDKERIEGHIASCARCRHILITLARLEEEKKAMKCDDIKDKSHTMKEKISISLTWVKDRLILTKTNIESFYYWNAISSALIPSRNGAQGDERELPPFTQTFPKCKVIVKIRKEAKERSNIYCRVLSASGKQETGSPLTIDLILSGRRFRSSRLKDQAVSFEGIEPGNYTLVVREGGTQLAEISLTISPDAGK